AAIEVQALLDVANSHHGVEITHIASAQVKKGVPTDIRAAGGVHKPVFPALSVTLRLVAGRKNCRRPFDMAAAPGDRQWMASSSDESANRLKVPPVAQNLPNQLIRFCLCRAVNNC